MTVFEKSRPEDAAELLDMLNLTFSMAHCPHDFKKVRPQAYLHPETSPAVHYIAREDGRIRAAVAVYPETVAIGEDALKIGMVGSVSVHPYSEGRGYMKALMKMMLEDCDREFDLTALGGQRQRYGYFGYQPLGVTPFYRLNTRNARHALADVDASGIRFEEITAETPQWLACARKLHDAQPLHVLRPADKFIELATSESNPFYAVLRGGEMIGYGIGAIRELVLRTEADLFPVLKAWFAAGRSDAIEMPAPVYNFVRCRALNLLCESSRVQPNDLFRLNRFARVLDVLLRFKSRYFPLAEGRVVVAVQGQPSAIALEVKNGEARACETNEPAQFTYALPDFYRVFLSPAGAFSPLPLPLQSWLPLEFSLSYVDFF